MADYSSSQAVHEQLAANVVDTVTLTHPAWTSVEIVNHDTTARVYFTTDGSTPTIKGNDTYVAVPYSATVAPDLSSVTETVVKLISDAEVEYSVTGQARLD